MPCFHGDCDTGEDRSETAVRDFYCAVCGRETQANRSFEDISGASASPYCVDLRRDGSPGLSRTKREQRKVTPCSTLFIEFILLSAADYQAGFQLGHADDGLAGIRRQRALVFNGSNRAACWRESWGCRSATVAT